MLEIKKNNTENSVGMAHPTRLLMMLGLWLFVLSVGVLADGLQVMTSSNGDLTVDNGKWQYTFRSKDNLLTSIAKSKGGPSVLADIPGGGGHWIYVTGSGRGNDPKRLYRQGDEKVIASHEILSVDNKKAVIRFVTTLNALRIEDVLTFDAQTGFVTQTFEVKAVKTIPNLTLLSWQAKLGTGGGQAEPFDWFLWGSGAECIVRDEDKLKTDGTLQKPGVKVDIQNAKTSTYWLRPKSMDEKFIAMLSRKQDQFWMLAFPNKDNSPWYFLGDRGTPFNYSTWFGFRVFGDTIYAETMPAFAIEAGTQWTGTVCHILGTGQTSPELTQIYNNWQKNEIPIETLSEGLQNSP